MLDHRDICLFLGLIFTSSESELYSEELSSSETQSNKVSVFSSVQSLSRIRLFATP